MAEAVGATLFNVGRVFDGERVHGELSVLVVAGVIAEVAERLEPPASVEVVQAPGKTLLPGLIDGPYPRFFGQLAPSDCVRRDHRAGHVR